MLFFKLKFIFLMTFFIIDWFSMTIKGTKSNKTTQNKRPTITYSDAGVDISKGDDLVSKISPIAKSTLEVLILSSK